MLLHAPHNVRSSVVTCRHDPDRQSAVLGASLGEAPEGQGAPAALANPCQPLPRRTRTRPCLLTCLRMVSELTSNWITLSTSSSPVRLCRTCGPVRTCPGLSVTPVRRRHPQRVLGASYSPQPLSFPPRVQPASCSGRRPHLLGHPAAPRPDDAQVLQVVQRDAAAAGAGPVPAVSLRTWTRGRTRSGRGFREGPEPLRPAVLASRPGALHQPGRCQVRTWAPAPRHEAPRACRHGPVG